MPRLQNLNALPGALKLAAVSSRGTLLRHWLYVPIGIMVMLVACFGIDVLFKKLSVSFPASVACLVLLFLALIAAEAGLGSHRTRKLVGLIDVSAGWSLRWMGVFFTPSFVLLPLSPPIGISEVFKIIGVFVIGFFIMMALAAYLTRGLQLLLGSSKHAESQRAEELGARTPDIPLTRTPDMTPNETPDLSRRTSFSQTSTMPLVPMPPSSRPQSPPQLRLQEHHYSNGHAADSVVDALRRQAEYPSQIPLPAPRAEEWAAAISANLDVSTFVMLFLFVGLPLYYTTGYAMPIQLSLNILAYFAATALPAAWKQYLHPVLVSSLLTVLFLWALASIRGDSLTTALHAYRTGAKYLQLWENTKAHQLPGAGDVFGTLLDASIVALALPMFQYRRELRAHFVSIAVPNVAIAVASLFAYPPLCFALGISAERSLAFSSRSLTLALAVPATVNLGGDVNTVAALAIISGILGVIFGQRILAFLRIPEDDYVTRGVTLGVNSSAIATALLLRTDPRAAALSSLSMSLFGTVTVLFTSIPPVAAVVRSLVGLVEVNRGLESPGHSLPLLALLRADAALAVHDLRGDSRDELPTAGLAWRGPYGLLAHAPAARLAEEGAKLSSWRKRLPSSRAPSVNHESTTVTIPRTAPLSSPGRPGSGAPIWMGEHGLCVVDKQCTSPPWAEEPGVTSGSIILCVWVPPIVRAEFDAHGVMTPREAADVQSRNDTCPAHNLYSTKYSQENASVSVKSGSRQSHTRNSAVPHLNFPRRASTSRCKALKSAKMSTPLPGSGSAVPS
ncbi:hypothetical protein G7046_g3415 [Stylonectria norvegica]|nr:hypothetical protein G7046_g3415 [Stylonectria norvegica]